MNRAHFAAFMAKSCALVDTLHLAPAEAADLALRLAFELGNKAGLSGNDLHSKLDDLRAVHTIEGGNGGGND